MVLMNTTPFKTAQVAAVFIAQSFNIDLSMTDQLSILVTALKLLTTKEEVTLLSMEIELLVMKSFNSKIQKGLLSPTGKPVIEALFEPKQIRESIMKLGE